jgi:hypothetical protein
MRNHNVARVFAGQLEGNAQAGERGTQLVGDIAEEELLRGRGLRFRRRRRRRLRLRQA